MVVAIPHVGDCPNVVLVRERLRQALDVAGAAATILIDGVDPFAGQGMPPALSCRLFGDAGSVAGVPAVSELAAALTANGG